MSKKRFTKRSLVIFSRHPSHNVLRRKVLVPAAMRAVVRFGSTTESSIEKELNPIEGVRNSSSKLRMKTCFDQAEVKTAQWWRTPLEVEALDEIPFPIIAKRVYGSRGEGMKKLNNQEEFTNFVTRSTNIQNYIFERFHNYVREYRLHIDAQGCFYTCRKMLKGDTPEDQKWFRNDKNCVWFLEDNEHFDKPVNWDDIVNECVKALNAVGLDFGACDVRVQGAKNGKGQRRGNPEFIIVEINSAPSFGDVTAEKYKERLPQTLAAKYS